MAINLETHVSGSFNMSKELYEQLKNIAKKNHRSISAEICRLVEIEVEKEVGKEGK